MGKTENENQYQITKRLLKEFEDNLKQMNKKKVDLQNLLLHIAEINCIKSKIEDFEKEIREWKETQGF